MVLILGTLLGGLGIFLLAVGMITDGLKLAAGQQLKAILERWTTSRLRGVASGMLVTAVVQSSSAVTVATIGFVNAGLLSLGQSLGVIYGANVGTTMTGWIVAAVGFSFRIEALALPMIGLGMFARMLRPQARLGDIGMAVAGFGLFFIGIDLMKGAFESFAADVDLAALRLDGFFGLVVYVLLGILMTVLTQSSSAAIAITLTAATGGVLSIDAAAATVIGANVGTTSTAALAVIGATANARRVAAAHVVFNLLTGLVALILLPLLLWLVRATGELLGLQDIPAVTLALFHTTFNVFGVALMWPWTTRLARFLNERFTTEAELLARPQFLDSNVLQTPALALEALKRELVRAFAITRDLVGRSLAPDPADRALRAERAAVDALCLQISAFVTRIHAARLPAELESETPQALRIVGYLEEIDGLLDDFAVAGNDITAIATGDPAGRIPAYLREVGKFVQRCDPTVADVGADTMQPDYLALRDKWRSLKQTLLEAATQGVLPVDNLNLALEGLRAALRIAEQSGKAADRMSTLLHPDRSN